MGFSVFLYLTNIYFLSVVTLSFVAIYRLYSRIKATFDDDKLKDGVGSGGESPSSSQGVAGGDENKPGTCKDEGAEGENTDQMSAIDDKLKDGVGSGGESPSSSQGVAGGDENKPGTCKDEGAEGENTDQMSAIDDKSKDGVGSGGKSPSSSQGAAGGDENKPGTCKDEGAEGENTDQMSAIGSLMEQFKKLMGSKDEPKLESVLDEVSFEGIARYILSDKCHKIVTMAGAGISTSAGIPDFRTPGTGLYDNLQKYNLPHPQAIFQLDYFKEKPEPFFMLCKDLMPGFYKPTPCHYFIKLLDEKKKLLRHFTQNIDTLGRVAGLEDEKIVEAHGSFATAHCLECRAIYQQDWVKEKILAGTEETPGIPRCEKEDCDGVVKPDIVFFGESLPEKFITHVSDLSDCDLLIIMGTSLLVQPFASLTNRVGKTTPRLYINLEKTGVEGGDPIMALLTGGQTFTFDSEDNIRDIFWQGTCDDGCYALANLLGWGDELREMVKTQHAILDKKEKDESKAPTKKTAAL